LAPSLPVDRLMKCSRLQALHITVSQVRWGDKANPKNRFLRLVQKL
jgi:hypothetical protein